MLPMNESKLLPMSPVYSAACLPGLYHPSLSPLERGARRAGCVNNAPPRQFLHQFYNVAAGLDRANDEIVTCRPFQNQFGHFCHFCHFGQKNRILSRNDLTNQNGFVLSLQRAQQRLLLTHFPAIGALPRRPAARVAVPNFPCAADVHRPPEL